MKTDQKALTKRSEDQSKWYQEVVLRAKLADYSPVRGCMVIRPYGYALWENIQRELDTMIKAAGVQNAYFPLFIPYSFLSKEAEHVEGFAPEVATVTHAGGEELEEKLVVRPTSETIINKMFSEWVESYRDLPMKINQWANIVRWEKRTTPFLRTTEFLWQEGHTIHATEAEAAEEVLRALEMYYDLVTNYLGMHVIKGYKTKAEKFAGADYTTTIEAMMKDGKALQSGTSHMLGQNFARAFETKFTDSEGVEQLVWQTSWGLSTRIIGGIILQHGDDKGLVLPPKVAPVQVQIIPVGKAEDSEVVREFIDQIALELKKYNIRFEIDDTDNSVGWKFAEAEMRGVPLRLEVGPRDVANNAAVLVTRIGNIKETVSFNEIINRVGQLLEKIQEQLYSDAKEFTEEHTVSVTNYQEFLAQASDPEFTGFIKAYFCGDPELEKQIKEATKFTSRCVPFETYAEEGKCMMNGEAGKLTLFARAY